MDREDFATLDPIQQEMWLIVARFYCYHHACLEESKRLTATFEELMSLSCEYIEEINVFEYQELLGELQRAAFYVVQEESLFD